MILPIGLALIAPIVLGQIYIGFPLNEQLPNVARTDQPYDFQFAADTYKSWSGASVLYSVSNLPQWLLFSSSSRTFTGTPSTSNVGEFQITLSGVDNGDNTVISNNYTMIVSQDSGLHLTSNDTMFVEIAKYGQTNGQDGLVLKQGDKFDIAFDNQTFTSDSNSTRPIIAYYGRTSDRSSLPAWIQFDSSKLSFSGTVPYVTSTIAPSFEYAFSFIGSDYNGYAGAEGIFKILVGAHQLSTSINETIKINGTFENDFNVNVPVLSQVYLDGNLIAPANISLVKPNGLPSYVTLNSNYTLSGVFPNSLSHDNFTLTVSDVFQNSIEIPYSFDSIGSVFTLNNLPLVNATKGSFFNYQLMSSWFTNDDTNVTVNYNANWLTYHLDNKTLNGLVPSSLDNLLVNVVATSGGNTETKLLEISSTGKSTNPSGTSSSTPSSTSSSKPSSTHQSTPKSRSKKNLAIGLGVGIPAGILAIALILFCCLRRKNKDKETEMEAAPEKQIKISSPQSPKDSLPIAPVAAVAAGIAKEEEDYDDIRSTSSTITHVESNPKYLEAAEKPMKSWRAESKAKRESELSLDTVNTEQLFSVRLVDDKSYRNLSQSDSLNSRNFLSSNSLSGVLTRSSLSNIQRLDSYGNLADIIQDPHGDPRLDAVSEESSRINTLNTIATAQFDKFPHHDDASGKFHDEDSSYNLLSKFELRNPSQSNSERDFSNYDIKNMDADRFLATKDETGEFMWAENNSNFNLSNSTAKEFVPPLLEHVSHETLRNGSTVSVGTVGSKAKLIDFTRKGSLRESVHEHEFNFGGVAAKIVRDDSVNF